MAEAHVAKLNADKVAKTLLKLLPLADQPDLRFLKSLLQVAYDEALSMADRCVPSAEELKFIRDLESHSREFAAAREQKDK